MAEFKYTYLDDTMHEVTGVMEAENLQETAAILKSFGYKVLSVNPVRQNVLDFDVSEFLFGIPRVDVITFTIQVATMLEAGLTILAALDVLMEQATSPGMKVVIRTLRRDVASGMKFSDAIARHPRVFTDMFISMVKVGEATGLLDQVLSRMADFYDREEELKSTIRSALAYPMFLMAVACGVVFFLLSFVLPRFTDIFKSFNVELPKVTRLLLAISSFFGAWWKIILLAVVSAVILIWYIGKHTASGRAFFHRLILWLPLISPVVIKSSLARFCHTLSTLLRSGIPIMRGLEITSSVIGNVVYASRIDLAIEKINSGNKLSESINDKRLFPPLVMRMMAVGENTGSTEALLLKVRDYFERDVQKSVKAMVSAIEPLMIFFLAIVVGFIVLAVMMPLLDMSRLYKV
ncbi:MAG: type II secretion system F family protein [Candidatus Wallbacteria bacterium]|nr:type II secretion system F family protein [Candidatus Wallbacteria bacterium]